MFVCTTYVKQNESLQLKPLTQLIPNYHDEKLHPLHTHVMNTTYVQFELE